MSCTPQKFYSVYNRHTDELIYPHGRRDEIMAVVGLTKASFYTYVTRTRKGTAKGKYEIFVDEEDDEDGS